MFSIFLILVFIFYIFIHNCSSFFSHWLLIFFSFLSFLKPKKETKLNSKNVKITSDESARSYHDKGLRWNKIPCESDRLFIASCWWEAENGHLAGMNLSFRLFPSACQREISILGYFTKEKYLIQANPSWKFTHHRRVYTPRERRCSKSQIYRASELIGTTLEMVQYEARTNDQNRMRKKRENWKERTNEQEKEWNMLFIRI